jgi:transcriptional regulator with XRE-family HTH domain
MASSGGEDIEGTELELALPPEPSRAPVSADGAGADAHPFSVRAVHPQDRDALIRLAHYLEARRGLRSDAALARAAGVHRSTIARWKQGEAPAPENARMLRELATVVSRLAEQFDPDQIAEWMLGESTALRGRRPVDVLRAGGLIEVLAAAETKKGGAFL